MNLEMTVPEESEKIISKIVIAGDSVKDVMPLVYKKQYAIEDKDGMLSVSKFLFQLNSFMNFVKDGNVVFASGRFMTFIGKDYNIRTRVLKELYTDMTEAIHELYRNDIDLKEELKEFVKFD